MNIGVLFTLFLSIFFLISGISKLSGLKKFEETLRMLNVSQKYVSFGAIFFSISEIIVAVGILYDPYRSVVGFIKLILIIFLFIVTLNVLKGDKKIKCNCFGGLTEENFGLGALFKLFLLLIMVLYVLLNRVQLQGTDYREIIFQLLISVTIVFSYIALMSIININRSNRK